MTRDESYSQTIYLYVHDRLPVTTIAERLDVKPPCVRRRLRRAGLYNPKEQRQNHKAKVNPVNNSRMDPDTLAAERINREPCQRCGVRADIGCRHVGHPRLGFAFQ